MNTEQTQSLFVVLLCFGLMTAAHTDYVKMLKIASINQLTD